jgi:hypothetical protein
MRVSSALLSLGRRITILTKKNAAANLAAPGAAYFHELQRL